jgi:hypothetical protein
MSQNKKTKSKKHQSHFEIELERLTSQIGFAAMSAAALLSLVEVEHLRSSKVEVLQPAYANVNAAPVDTNRGDELMRREKEESPHSIVSYGTAMRSHATAGKQ